MGLDARCSFAIADISSKLCPCENPRFADNGAFKLAVIGYDHYCRECHSQSCVTGEIFCGPSSTREYRRTVEGSAEVPTRSPKGCGYDSA